MSANLVRMVGFCGIGAMLATSCGGRTPIGEEPAEGIGTGGGMGVGTGGGAGTAGSAGTAGTYGGGGTFGTGGTYGSGGYAGGSGGAGGSAGTYGSGGYAGYAGAGGYAGGYGGGGGYAGGYGGAGGFAGGFGGSVGSGGAVPPPGCRNAPSPNEDVVDDMNDGDSFILFTNGRAGAWTTYHDVQTPNGKIFPDGLLSMSYTTDVCHGYAARVVGGPYTLFAGFSAGVGGPYNASGYTGLSFWAMSSTATTLRVAFPDIDTDPAGARCDPSGGSTGCYDHWGTYVTVSAGWTKIVVPFANLRQDGWGNLARTFRADTLFSIQFNIAAPQSVFDVWVDDVALRR
jgi:hypothetical protein